MSNSDAAIARFILASGSKRRRDIMTLAGFTFIVQDGIGGSSEITSEIEPDVYKLTQRNAKMKLSSAIAANRNRMPWNIVIIAADTVVALQGESLGKPGNREEAVAMLCSLRGRQHEVVTTVATTYSPLRQFSEAISHTVVSKVTMREYADDEIDDYISTGLPYDRAGAYGVQDSEFNPAASVVGCYLNVVGLPLCAVRAMLPPGECAFAKAHVYATCAAHEEMNTP